MIPSDIKCLVENIFLNNLFSCLEICNQKDFGMK